MKESSIKDVAKAAGVSISTVSKAINGTGRLSPKTRDSIIKIAKGLNYTPNSIAVSMVIKKSKIIAVMVPYVTSFFYSAVIQGVEYMARQYGYSTVVYCTDESEANERKMFRSGVGKLADGVLAIPSVNNPDIYAKYFKPVVLIDRNVDGSNLDCVMIDNFESTYILANKLIDAGHKRIAYLSGSTDINVGRDRLMGFEQAMRNARVPIDASLIYTQSWHEQYGYDFLYKLIEMQDKPTAILAGNGSICDGLLMASRELDIVLGEDISLAAVDDTKMSLFNRPEITVVNRETVGMGKIAMTMLHDKLEGKPESMQSKKIVLPVTLVMRNSIKQV